MGLTESSQDGDGCRLLGLVAQTQLVDGLDTKHVGLSFGQATDHKPAVTCKNHNSANFQKKTHF